MPARSPQDREVRAFTAPEQVNQRRYEALRAFFVEGLSHAEAGERFGYTRWGMVNLVRDHRAGKLELFAPQRKPGPAPGTAPAKERVRARVIELRREGLSTYEISARLAGENTPLNRTSVGEILTEEGFGRLLRHPEPVASTSPATPGRDTRLPRTGKLDFQTWPATVETGKAGLLLLIPDLVALGLPELVRRAGYPGTRVVPATSWLLSLLALKLTRTRRVSHVDDLLISDPAAALFAGLAALPKKSALTDYSYRTGHDHQRRFLAALDAKMIDGGLATGENAVFDLDFHAVMHWGHDPALEKHYVPTRSQRARSVLTFFAQDTGTHNLVYANADLSKATQAREVIAFCDHWKTVSGTDPAMLIMDQKVTTHTVLGELNDRGVKFLTLRMRSASLVKQIDALTGKDFTTVTLDRPGKFNRPKVCETTGVHLTGYPATVRQLVVTGLGRDTPTVIITNDHDLPAKALIAHYARRMTIEQRLAEIIQAFHADALSSAVNLNVDLDIMLCVLAQALTAALRNRLPGYAAVTPDVLQRRFLETPGQITTTNDTITVRLDRRAYTPVLRQADLAHDTTVPWWGNRTLRYEFN
ncbi:homeo-like domain protein [Mycobacterium kansasii 732]|uniref:transposase n=1 Tax=Mycobacterium pseudokansasii TaxID=2341080 RepID=UPI0004539FBD|nr:transposase [Mycobacterium pseudokansasii]ETZ99677.1 homeo-like domain protein [Mycobacterium kansasii 732]EUA05849.1 homeo-like domain protein [Mycobacterium kansasii 732]EUA06118.1 homeo-like domain protein [Mycobacterium kansasii 732]EUA09379.1 homeo-like domain protein [Mycobacterium kansasii 732]